MLNIFRRVCRTEDHINLSFRRPIPPEPEPLRSGVSDREGGERDLGFVSGGIPGIWSAAVGSELEVHAIARTGPGTVYRKALRIAVYGDRDDAAGELQRVVDGCAQADSGSHGCRR